jgi:hypothetical protein
MVKKTPKNKTKQNKKNSVVFFTFSFEDVIKDQEKQEHNKSTAKAVSTKP